MAGKIFIADVRDKGRILGNFLVQSKQVPLNKNGKAYLALVLMDRTGSMEARLWDNVEKFEPGFDSGDFVKITADAVSYQGRVQLKLSTITRLDPDKANLEEYLPCSPRDRGEMLARVGEIVEGIRNAPLKELLQNALRNEKFRQDLSRAPAAKTIHHAYIGGLLEHTLSVMELAIQMAAHYPHLDRDLLVAGAFLHDLGKIKELGQGRNFDYSDEGRLVGHLVIGAMMLKDWVRDHGGLPDDLLLKLTHMILAHHGSYEFGSPRRPKFAEALMLHVLDEMDSKIQTFKEIAKREAGQSWTTYQRLFDRYLYLGQAKEDSPKEKAIEKTIDVAPAKPSRQDELPNKQLTQQLNEQIRQKRTKESPQNQMPLIATSDQNKKE